MQLTPAILTTARLKLRWLDARDAPALFAVFSDPEVMRYWSSPAWTDMAQAEAAIEQSLEACRAGASLRFGVELAATGEVIGTVTLYAFYAMNRRCEIGYALARAHWGRGYVAEALSAALDYGFRTLDLNRVEADIDPRNAASGRVLERLGFRKEGYMRERWIVNGEVCDSIYYGLLRSDWDARPPAA